MKGEKRLNEGGSIKLVIKTMLMMQVYTNVYQCGTRESINKPQ